MASEQAGGLVQDRPIATATVVGGPRDGAEFASPILVDGFVWVPPSGRDELRIRARRPPWWAIDPEIPTRTARRYLIGIRPDTGDRFLIDVDTGGGLRVKVHTVDDGAG